MAHLGFFEVLPRAVRSELKALQDDSIRLVREGGDADRIMELNTKASSVGQDLDRIERDLAGLAQSNITEHDVAEAFGSLEEFWGVLFPTEKQRIVQTLVERITVWPDGLDLKLKAVGVAGLVADLNAYADEARQREGQACATAKSRSAPPPTGGF